VTAGRRYLLGVGSVPAALLILSAALGAEARVGVWVALGTALAIQGPLGWWLVRAIGSPRFLLVWAVGIAARFALVALFALVVAPRLRLALAPTLFALVCVLIGCVVVEALVVGARQRQAEVR